MKRSKVGKFNEKTSILLDDLLKIGQTHGEFNCISTTISMLDDILAYEIEEQIDIENLSFGRSIKIDEKKIINFLSLKKNINIEYSAEPKIDGISASLFYKNGKFLCLYCKKLKWWNKT